MNPPYTRLRTRTSESSEFPEVTQQVNKLIWSPCGDPSALRPGQSSVVWPVLHRSDVPMEEFSSEVEQKALGVSEPEVLVFNAQYVW